jgi:hypothetical protein
MVVVVVGGGWGRLGWVGGWVGGGGRVRRCVAGGIPLFFIQQGVGGVEACARVLPSSPLLSLPALKHSGPHHRDPRGSARAHPPTAHRAPLAAHRPTTLAAHHHAQACGREADCIDLYKRIEQEHPVAKIKKQAYELRYIMEAPKLTVGCALCTFGGAQLSRF